MKKILVSICIASLLLVSCVTKSAGKNESVNKAVVENPSDVPKDAPVEIEAPLKLELTGTVQEIIENKGTFSEISYFIIINDKVTQTILFNEKGFSEGFKEWIGKKVIVQGYNDTGIIGFKRTQKRGFVVLNIRDAESVLGDSF